MTRVLFMGDLAGTGFGTVTMDLGRELLALGHDVRFVSQNDGGTLPEPFASRTLQTNLALMWGGWRLGDQTGEPPRISDLFDGTAWEDGWTAEASIILGDPVAARYVVLASPESRAAFGSLPVLHYVPVEGVDLPPRWAEMWKVVHPVAMCEFGADQLARILPERPPVVYHGVDTSAFWPVSSARPIRLGDAVLRSREDCKRYFGQDPRRMMVLRTDRHMPRKRYNSLFRAMAPVMATRPNVDLVIHCQTADQGGNLFDTLSKFPAGFQKRVISTGFHDALGGVARPMLNAIYNAADVYVTVSAEGFGLTVAEALACGVPVVGMDFSAVPEVIGPAGLTAKVAGLIENEYDHYWAAVDERDFGAKVATLLDNPAQRHLLGAKGPRHVAETFRWDRAALQFSDLIREALREEVAA